MQLHLLEGAILKAEQDFEVQRSSLTSKRPEASWAKACFSKSSLDAYVDEALKALIAAVTYITLIIYLYNRLIIYIYKLDIFISSCS